MGISVYKNMENIYRSHVKSLLSFTVIKMFTRPFSQIKLYLQSTVLLSGFQSSPRSFDIQGMMLHVFSTCDI